MPTAKISLIRKVNKNRLREEYENVENPLPLPLIEEQIENE